jgi:hypothetical protein
MAGKVSSVPGRSSLSEHLPVQRKAELGGAAPSGAEVQRIASTGVAGAGGALPHVDRIQRLFGRHDVTGVKAHVGGAATSASQAIGAEAYATGNNVAFANSPSLHTAAHEAAHVVQQRGGVQLKDGTGQSGDAYERHADAVADLVVQGQSAEHLLDEHAGTGGREVHAPAVQRRDQNGPYLGNRPNPVTSTAAGYTIKSSEARILQVGDTVDYEVAPPAHTAGKITARWWIVNDPSAVATEKVRAVENGPADQLRMHATAQLPGNHHIHAMVSVDGREVGEVTYTQQVVSKAGLVDVPASATAAPLSMMADFIAMMRRIEQAYAGTPWQDVVSRIRKECYPGPGGEYGGIKASFTWDDLIDEQEDVPGLEVPPVAMSDVAAIRRHHVVTTETGEHVDIGHVLTGADSFNFPGVNGIFARHNMEGPAAATWSGDVGSALVKWANEATDDKSETKKHYYDRLAGSSDMLGDVDALAMAHGPNLALPASASLSQRLEAFYQPALPRIGTHQRFHGFCRASRFALENDQLDAAVRKRIRDQVLQFAQGYDIKGTIVSASIIGDGGSVKDTPMGRIIDNVDWFANHFVDWVNAGLKAEGPM